MKILVRNLSRKTTASRLMKLFAPFGTILSLDIVIDEKTNKSKGFGFVEMSDVKQANKAIEALNDTEVDGFKLRVKLAKK